MNQKDRIVSLLKSGRNFTVAQLAGMVDGSTKSVTGRIAELRAEGLCIYTNTLKNGKRAYRLGTPSREMVSLAWNVAGPSVFSK